MRTLITLFILLALLLPLAVADDCSAGANGENKSKARPLKIGAIFSILFFGAVGVCLPILGKWIPWLRPEKDFFFIVKAFAAGVILATGFVHILPDGFDKLTSSCLSDNPWHKFPFAGFAAMVAAMGTLMIDTLATGYFTRLHFRKPAPVGDEQKPDVEAAAADADNAGHVHVHTHATHGHAHGPVAPEDSALQLIRYRIVSEVLELGIVVHSVIIGISLGASDSPSTVRPLLVALSFHQCFEGMGLGGCIVQAKFKIRSVLTMMLFFSLTTPVGIAIGIAISSSYNENSPTALIVEGILNSLAAGILIYMALVDLLAEDFMNPKVQSNVKLQVLINAFLLLGAGLMSLLAKWA